MEWRLELTTTCTIANCKCPFHQPIAKSELFSKYKETHPKCECSYCDGMVRHPYLLVRSDYQLVFDKECRCNACNQSFTNEYEYQTHVNLVHEPRRNLHVCTYCTKRFAKQDDLERHLGTHDTTKPFKCVLCNYKAKDLQNLRDHSLSHNFTFGGET